MDHPDSPATARPASLAEARLQDLLETPGNPREALIEAFWRGYRACLGDESALTPLEELPVAALELTPQTREVVAGAGFETIGDIVSHHQVYGLLSLDRFTGKVVEEIRRSLAAHRLTLSTDPWGN